MQSDTPVPLPGDVEDEAEHLADLYQGRAADIATRVLDPARSNSAYVLALSRRRAVQPILAISLEFHFGPEPSKR